MYISESGGKYVIWFYCVVALGIVYIILLRRWRESTMKKFAERVEGRFGLYNYYSVFMYLTFNVVIILRLPRRWREGLICI